MALLELASVNTFYGRSHILFDVSLSVEKGEVVSLLGRHGAGKSTTFRSLIALPPPPPPGSGAEPRHPAVGWGTADAHHRPNPDDEPRPAPPRRTVGGPRAADRHPPGRDDPEDPSGVGAGPARRAEPPLLRQGCGPGVRDRQGGGEGRGEDVRPAGGRGGQGE